MRKALAGLLATLMVLTVGVGTVTATGNSSASLAECTNEVEGYYGGVKVYAKDGTKGASRVMCPPTEEEIPVPAAVGDRQGDRLDRNLNARNKNRPPLEDIWKGFFKNIESFKLRAAPGCLTLAALLGPGDLQDPEADPFTKVLDNTDGATSRTRRFEVPRRRDNDAVAVGAAVFCPAPDIP
jgi:hypothetical protein